MADVLAILSFVLQLAPLIKRSAKALRIFCSPRRRKSLRHEIRKLKRLCMYLRNTAQELDHTARDHALHRANRALSAVDSLRAITQEASFRAGVRHWFKQKLRKAFVLLFRLGNLDRVRLEIDKVIATLNFINTDQPHLRFISLEQAFVLFERRNHEVLTNNQRPDETINENVEQHNEESLEQPIEDTMEEEHVQQLIEENIEVDNLEEACAHPKFRIVSAWKFSIVVYCSQSMTIRCITCGHTETLSRSSGLLKEDAMGRRWINWDHITTGSFLPGGYGIWRS